MWMENSIWRLVTQEIYYLGVKGRTTSLATQIDLPIGTFLQESWEASWLMALSFPF